jgi:hypothetical protein
MLGAAIETESTESTESIEASRVNRTSEGKPVDERMSTAGSRTRGNGTDKGI